MTAPTTPGRGPLRTTRPRTTGVICLILTVILIGMGALLISSSSFDSALAGPGVALIVLAVLCALIAVLVFQVARNESGALKFTGPLQLFTILSFVVGVGGAALGIITGGATGSPGGIGAGVAVLVASLIVALQGALAYGAAQFRA